MAKAQKPRKDRGRLATPSDLGANAVGDITGALNSVLADVFVLYMKTKNFHWHVSGPNFRDHHLMFDEQAAELFAMTDPIAERVRKIGGHTLHSIAGIARLKTIPENEAEYVDPQAMLGELREDNQALIRRLRAAHDVCDEHDDVASESLIEVWIDEAEKRVWFLFEAGRDPH
jgi:starvation-inducible DNA-binding protein